MYSALCWPDHTVVPGGYLTLRSKSRIGHEPFGPPTIHICSLSSPAKRPTRYIANAEMARNESSACVSFSSSCAWFVSGLQAS